LPLFFWLHRRAPHISACPSKLAGLGVNYGTLHARESSYARSVQYSQQRRQMYDSIEHITAMRGSQIARADTQGLTAFDLFKVGVMASPEACVFTMRVHHVCPPCVFIIGAGMRPKPETMFFR
jgi:hypothetical protein